MHLELPLVSQQTERNLFLTLPQQLNNEHTYISQQPASSEIWSNLKCEAQTIIEEYQLVSDGNWLNWVNVISLNGRKILEKRL